MKENLYDLLRRYEFNKTEPETLIQLVDRAIQRGGEAKEELALLRDAARRLLGPLRDGGLIQAVAPQDIGTVRSKTVGGVDGSFMPVGGAGGKWYVPLSCATLIFPEGINSSPQVTVESGIEVVHESESLNVGGLAACIEMALESKAILKFGSKFQNSILFIDGPIVDPPFYDNPDYVHHRSSAIRATVNNGNLVIACAKRVRDSFLKKVASDLLPAEIKYISRFPTDLQLLLFLFSEFWRDPTTADLVLATTPVNATAVGPDIYKKYQDEGVTVWSLFIQLTKTSSMLRLDLPTLDASDNGKPALSQIVDAVTAWSYPGHHIPLPVFLADEKCRIRTGCAEVLYQEIMTRTATADPLDQIVITQLR